MVDKRGKIGLLCATFIILLVSVLLISSALSNPNIKEYDKTTKTITIKDSSGSVISDITLNTPLVFKVIRGEDRRVAEFTIQNSNQYSDVFGKLDFYDIKKDMERFDRDFTYKYERSLGFEIVNDYETICVDGEDLGNGTVLQDCSQVLSGSHQEERFEWTVLDTSKDLPEGEITIGLFTDVKPNENVEWVPTLFGVEIGEWARWTESLNVNLVEYWDFEEGSGTNVEGSVGNYNLTSNSSTWPAGKLGSYGMNFSSDSSEKADTLGVVTEINGTNYSVNGWINLNSEADQGAVWKVGDDANDASGRLHLFYSSLHGISTDKWIVNVPNTEYAVGSSTNGDVGTYIMFTMRYDISTKNLSIWKDGSLDSSVVTTNTYNPGGFWIGHGLAPTQPAYGRMVADEVGLWNRSLTDAEIDQLYNDGDGITYTDDFSNYTITFNLTDGVTGGEIDTGPGNPDIESIICDNGFSVSGGDIENPYTTEGDIFPRGISECNFTMEDFYLVETQDITANSNNTVVNVSMSREGGLTQEEHDWLEAVYECLINGVDCA
jgi:hypothetical protein